MRKDLLNPVFNLSGLNYLQLQPPILPRPDLSRLGIAYRRIPLLSIGRDVYLDTRLQLTKLEGLFPSIPQLGSTTTDHRALTRLLSDHITDGGVFARASQLIPTDLPLMQDQKFRTDRADFSGAPYSKEGMDKARPEALTEIARLFRLLEETLLADGREWLLKTDTPGLADLEAVWPLHWVTGMKGALEGGELGEKKFPKVYAWIARFHAAVTEAKKAGPKPTSIKGDEAANKIWGAAYYEAEGLVDERDPVVRAQGLRKGDVVTIWPTDTGTAHRDVGRLVSVDADEVVVEVKGEGKSVRLHAPRHGFRIRKGGEGKGGKL